MFGRRVICPSEPAYYIVDCRISCNEVSWVYEGFFGGKGKFLLIRKETLIFSEINSTGKTGIRKKPQ